MHKIEAFFEARKGWRHLTLLGFYWVSVLLMEFTLRVLSGDALIAPALPLILLFSLPFAVLFWLFTTAFSRRINRVIAIVLMSVLCFFFGSQQVYNTIFQTYYTAYLVTGGGDAMRFLDVIIRGLWQSMPGLLVTFLPLVLTCTVVRWWLIPEGRPTLKQVLAGFCVFFAAQLAALSLLPAFSRNYGSPYSYYYEASNFGGSVSQLGMLTTMRLDLWRLAVGFDEPFRPEPIPEPVPTPEPEPDPEPQPTVYPDNVLEIDFDRLLSTETDEAILALAEHLKTLTPTRQNEKTGQFAGHNLILVTAEAFSPHAISPELTPTLYKMSTEGYTFENFYTPVWMGSTLAGEYVNLFGLLPQWEDGFTSFKNTKGKAYPFSLAHQLGDLGYQTFAFHNHVHTYYDRSVLHPNLGYTFLARGNGLNLKSTWPESDLELIDLTTSYYLDKDQPFHTYYITVSGHGEYTFLGNAMASKNRELVSHLPYSEQAQAYLACNIELDRAMELLLTRLEEAGVAENTLIVIAPDHYPYALPEEDIEALRGKPFEDSLELYRSILIMYEKGMTPETVTKPCSNIDLTPTILNLMGIPYDSRLFSGQDIFAPGEGLVPFMGRSWITDRGRYIAADGSFTPAEPFQGEEDYVIRTNTLLANRFSFDAGILKQDFYRVLLPYLKTE